MLLAAGNLQATQNVAAWLAQVPGPLGLSVAAWAGVQNNHSDECHGSVFYQNIEIAAKSASDTLLLHACITLKVSMGG